MKTKKNLILFLLLVVTVFVAAPRPAAAQDDQDPPGRVAISYMNREAPGAVTAVSRETFVNARPVAKESVRVTAEQIRSARVVDSAPLAPTRTSYVAATARVAAARPAFSFQQRAVVAKLPPRTPVSQRTYTNDSREFNREPARTNNVPPVARIENAAPPARVEHPQPPTRVENAPPPARQSDHATQPGRNDERTVTPNRAEEEAKPRERPPVRFSPPDKAKENEYDVHPPLNRNPSPQSRKEQRPAPPPRSEEHQESHRPPK